MRGTEPPPVLVVGDDERYRTSVAQVLRLAGHPLVLTSDPRAAVAMLRSGLQPALCVVDGPVDADLAAELTARSSAGRDDPIVLLEPGGGLLCRPLFPTSLTLSKPVTDRELVAAVASMSIRER